MKLAEYMDAHGLDDAAMAGKIGKSRVSVSRYRRGIEIPGSETIKDIVAACNGEVTANELLGIAQVAAE